MNACCKLTLQQLQDQLARTAEVLIEAAGAQETVMEKACARRAEIIVDVMAQVKAFATGAKGASPPEEERT